MKEILKKILAIILYLLIPGIFGGVGAGVFFLVIEPPMEARRILKNGIETTAVIMDIISNSSVSSSSGNTTRTENFYFLRLSFLNSEGAEIEYKTRSIYSERFIKNSDIKNSGTIQVIYLNNKAVVKGYIPKYETWLWLFPVIFGAIGAGFLILPVILYISGIGRSKNSNSISEKLSD